LWNRPLSPLQAFNKNSIGKCDVCFRAGFCSVSECSAQKTMEKNVISRIVNRAKLTGFVDNSIIKKMMKKVMKNKKVNFRKYARKIKTTLKKSIKNKKIPKKFCYNCQSIRIIIKSFFKERC